MSVNLNRYFTIFFFRINQDVADNEINDYAVDSENEDSDYEEDEESAIDTEVSENESENESENGEHSIDEVSQNIASNEQIIDENISDDEDGEIEAEEVDYHTEFDEDETLMSLSKRSIVLIISISVYPCNNLRTHTAPCTCTVLVCLRFRTLKYGSVR